MISGGRARRSARAAAVAGSILAAAVALLILGAGTAGALQPDPQPGGAQHNALSRSPSIQLIPAVSADIIVPAPGVAVELIPAAAATLAAEQAGVHIPAAAAHANQKHSAANDSGATTISQGSVSIELIPATSSELAPPPVGEHADSTAAVPAGVKASGAGRSGSSAGAAAENTDAEPVSVLAEASALAPAAVRAQASPPRTLPWILGALIAVLVGGATLIVAHTRRPVRH